MKKHFDFKFIFAFLLFQGFILQNLVAIDYYVSPKGNDNNPGTLEKPFRTLTKARDMVRKNNGSMKENIQIFLSHINITRSFIVVCIRIC